MREYIYVDLDGCYLHVGAVDPTGTTGRSTCNTCTCMCTYRQVCVRVPQTKVESYKHLFVLTTRLDSHQQSATANLI